MTIRSKLFATVAFPMLSMSIAIQPALADSLMKPFEVAQEDGVVVEGGEQAPEELLRKKRKKRAEQQQQEQPAEEEAQPSQEEQPSRAERRKKRQEAEQQQQEEAQPPADDEAARQAAEEKQRIRAERKKRQQAEQQQQEEAQPSADDEAAKAAEERAKIRAERKKRQQAEQQQQEEAQPPADDEAAKAAEERAKIRAERKKRQQAEQQQQQEEAQPSADDEAAKAAEERAKIRAERKKRQQAEQQQQQEEAQPSADDEAAKAAEERAKIRAERKKRQQAEQQQQQEEAQPSADDEAAKTAEERAKIRAERKKRQQAEGQQQEEGQQPVAEDEQRPAIDGEGEATETRRKRRDRRQPIPEIVDTRSEEEKQEIARDPAATDDTVVLPVDKGAAVLDSDKEADNAGDEGVREKRRKRREQARAQEENVEVPKSDEEAQSRRRDRAPTREELGANIREEGRRIERVPEFNVNDLIEAFTGSDSSRPRIDETRDNRVVLDFGDQIIVRGDDRPRLRRNAQETYYEELSRGRTREIIERPNGVRIITIYNRYGDIVQRLRIDRDGREYLMIYAPEVDEGPRPPIYDVGEELPPMRLRVPVRDYIIDTSSEPDRDYYDFLSEPPVEQVERVYSIDEVRNSARIRDKVRRIDLDTITFATGSAEVPMSQAKTLRKVADAMLQVIEKDPGETFFIEGHTDAVGSDESNLVLSDERAESVASLLTEVYAIPAENLVTQGYGERFLKVRTLEAEQENRRVTIRRVTPLVRPVAQN
ncbi:OmpA family protein [Pararhizobium sp. LjRoot238]|uniref:OmpA family protein n=1 Tax=Pararhizobium sp. LjRoot238 TaxID=3342293 RepID=UPI003ECF76DB